MTAVVTGMQATAGSLHIGNYIGALSSLKELGDRHDLFLFVADLHALTTHDGSEDIFANSLNMVATFIACGVDCNRSVVFLQSDVPQHSELCWILSCIAQFGHLSRMTQFKDKSQKNASNINLGLFSYPVLMAADILLYEARFVPVGDDQKQHLEFVRDIAIAFNKKYAVDLLVVPEPIIKFSRVMSLNDGMKKMSKSDPSDLSRINLTDTDDVIAKKIRKAKTDSLLSWEDLENRPEVLNLLNIFAALLGGSDIKTIVGAYNAYGMAKFKSDLIDLLISIVGPIRDRTTEIMSDRGELQRMIGFGRERAAFVAAKNLASVKQVVRVAGT